MDEYTRRVLRSARAQESLYAAAARLEARWDRQRAQVTLGLMCTLAFVLLPFAAAANALI